MSIFRIGSFNSTGSEQTPDERVIDDELRKLLKRLPNSTKRNLLQDLKNPDGGSTRGLGHQPPGGLNDRRASSPQFAAISETAPVEEPSKVGLDCCCLLGLVVVVVVVSCCCGCKVASKGGGELVDKVSVCL